MLIPRRGVCRLCGCTYHEPCVDEQDEVCGWADRTHTLCTHCEARGGPPPGFPRTREQWTLAAAASEAYRTGAISKKELARVVRKWARGREARFQGEFDLAVGVLLSRAENLGCWPPTHRGRAAILQALFPSVN